MADPAPPPAPLKPADWTPPILAIAGIVIAAYLVVALTTLPIPPQNKELLFALLGIVGGVIVGAPFGYYFASSAGSDAKTKAIADQASAARTLAEGTNGDGTTVHAQPDSRVTVDPTGEKAS